MFHVVASHAYDFGRLGGGEQVYVRERRFCFLAPISPEDVASDLTHLVSQNPSIFGFYSAVFYFVTNNAHFLFLQYVKCNMMYNGGHPGA
jgi:hypothetical protein